MPASPAGGNAQPSPYLTDPLPQVLAALRADQDAGLALAEVERRRQEFGWNEVAVVKPHPWRLFAKKFWGLTAWMLEAIIAISWVLRRIPDLVIVSALLVVNAILSFAQEQRASAAVEALRQRLQVEARALRQGEWRTVPARELVPGDVLRIRLGDFVPADVRLLGGELTVDQSALTGESLSVETQPGDAVYSGSIVRRGEATALVVLTGAHTYLGRTTELVQVARPRLHIEALIARVVQWLLWIVIVLLLVATGFSLARGLPLLDIVPLLLILLLGAIPVALPVMFTVSMALGSIDLARKGALVTRLSAAEDAARMDTLYVDKTGTITANHLAVANVLAVPPWHEQDAVLYGALASQAANADPIDEAFLHEAQHLGLRLDGYRLEQFIPFDPQTRRTEAVLRHAVSGAELHVVKGAVHVVEQICCLESAATRDLDERIAVLAAKGYRTLAVAVGDPGSCQRQGTLQATPAGLAAVASGETPGTAAVAAGDHGQDFQLVGLVSLYDAPRPDSARLIRELRALGVRVKMLTGDALPIAREVAREVGLGAQFTRFADLQALAQTDPAAAARMADASEGMAEIYPEGKYVVVQTAQAAGHVVGMTGDGVNDAPALRQAEVGIAVASATDVAKGAASVVLTSEGLVNIVELIKQGRMIHQRIATWIVNKISRTILKSVLIVLPFILTGRFVISSLATLLVLFMTDFVKITLATDNVRWSPTPERWDVTGLVKVGAALGVLMSVEALVVLWAGVRWLGLADPANELALHTFSFELLLYFALFSILVVRERGHFWQSRPSNTLLFALIADGIVAALIGTFGLPGMAPVTLLHTGMVIAASGFFSLLVNDAVKCTLFGWLGLQAGCEVPPPDGSR